MQVHYVEAALRKSCIKISAREFLRRIRPRIFYFEVISNLTYARAPPAPHRLMSMPPCAAGPNAPAPYAARALDSGRQKKARYCARLPRSAALPLLQQKTALPQPRGPLLASRLISTFARNVKTLTSSFCATDSDNVYRSSTGRFVSPSVYIGFRLFFVFEETFKDRCVRCLGGYEGRLSSGRTDPSAFRPARSRPAPTPRRAPRLDPRVVCPGFGFDKYGKLLA